MDKVIKGTLMFCALAGAMGCASVRLPVGEVAEFEASMKTAKELGAYTMPAAQTHTGALGMSRAREHLILAGSQAEVARQMASAGDARGTLFLARAQSDADLALALTREAALRGRALRLAGERSAAPRATQLTSASLTP